MHMKENEKTWYRICKMLCEYKKYFPGIICCLLGSSFITFLHPLIIRQITDSGMLQKKMKYIFLFSVILIIISLTQQELNIIQTRLFANVHNQFMHSLYKKTYWKINRMKIQYFDDRGSAEIINTISMDIDNVSSVVDQITQFSISSILQIIGGVIGLSLLDWKLAILIEAIIPLKFIIVSYCANRKRKVFEQWIEDKRKFMSWFAECINGIHEMKLWNLFQVKNPHFECLQKDLMDSYKKNAMLDEYSTVSVVIMDAFVNALLYILSGLFIIKGEFTIGGAFAFITYSAYVVNPISSLINIKYYFAQIEPSAKRLFKLWEQPEEQEMKSYSMEPVKFSQDKDIVFEVKDLFFGYESGHSILNGVSLCVKKGERVAIIGENGSGKSTLLNLLAGFYQPQKGIIKLCGVPVELMDIQDMRNRIAVVSQRPYLFQGTIEENVNIDEQASRGAVVEACRKSGALSFIEKFDHGFEQKIGQDGAKLSGGERQKIAVARALLKNADIVLMDEATEGFDVESNESLHKLLHSELKNKTIIFITHKYNELERVDKVYRLSKGILELVSESEV